MRKKPREETGNIKGEKWVTAQQYIGDWKMNKKDGYGIKIYNNKDKYEGYWKNDMRHGKGTYWLCIGKNKYRKLYTGDWFENKKEGKGIFFYKDGGCYDGSWKNSKRHGKGLMIYSNGDTYEGNWQNDLKHGYGIMEYEFPQVKKGNKYYGYWCNGLKEGQGYYYYSDYCKIYLGEWHEDIPRTGIYTTVEDAKLSAHHENINISNIDKVPELRVLKLCNPSRIIEDSISNVHFVRQIKLTKSKNFSELFSPDYQQELITLFKYKNTNSIIAEGDSITKGTTERSKIPDSTITISDFKFLIKTKLNVDVHDDVLELILNLFNITNDDRPFDDKILLDFLLFSQIFYLVFIKYIQPPPEIDFSVHSQGDNEEKPKKTEISLSANQTEPVKTYGNVGNLTINDLNEENHNNKHITHSKESKHEDLSVFNEQQEINDENAAEYYEEAEEFEEEYEENPEEAEGSEADPN